MPKFCQLIFHVINFPEHCMAFLNSWTSSLCLVKLSGVNGEGFGRKSLVTSTTPKLEILTILSVMRLYRRSLLFLRNSTLNSYQWIVHVITVHSLSSQSGPLLLQSLFTNVNIRVGLIMTYCQLIASCRINDIEIPRVQQIC